MKKIFLTALVCAFSLISNAQMFSVNDVVVKNDGATAAKISFDLPLTDEFTAFQFVIEVPEGIKINKVKSGRQTIDDLTLDPARFEGLNHTINANLVVEGGQSLIKIACTSGNNSNFYNDDEDGNQITHLFDLGIVADASMTEGDYTLKFRANECKVISTDKTKTVAFPEYTSKLTIGAPTGINGLEAENGAEVVAYDMAGRRVNAAAKGVKVINGKKVIK